MAPRDDEKTGKGLGAEIRRLRKERGWTLRQLAEAAELDFGYVGKIERGEVAPVSTYRRLAAALGAQLSIEIVRKGRRAAPSPQAAARRVHAVGAVNPHAK